MSWSTGAVQWTSAGSGAASAAEYSRRLMAHVRPSDIIRHVLLRRARLADRSCAATSR